MVKIKNVKTNFKPYHAVLKETNRNIIRLTRVPHDRLSIKIISLTVIETLRLVQ